MSTRQLSLGDFAAHCLEEIEAVQSGDTVLEILSSGGKVIAVLNPPPAEHDKAIGGVSLADWTASGAGLMSGDFDSSCLHKPTLMFADDAVQDFWQPMSALQQAEQQEVPAVTSPEALLGDGTEEEWQGFDEALETWRSERVIHPFSAAADVPHAA